MTVKELFMSVSFDELLPFLKEYETKHLDNIYAFREAYDILRNMEPNKNYQNKVTITCNAESDHYIRRVFFSFWMMMFGKMNWQKKSYSKEMSNRICVKLPCFAYGNLHSMAFLRLPEIILLIECSTDVNRWGVTRLPLTNWRKVYGNIRHLADCDIRMRMEED